MIFKLRFYDSSLSETISIVASQSLESFMQPDPYTLTFTVLPVSFSNEKKTCIQNNEQNIFERIDNTNSSVAKKHLK